MIEKINIYRPRASVRVMAEQCHMWLAKTGLRELSYEVESRKWASVSLVLKKASKLEDVLVCPQPPYRRTW